MFADLIFFQNAKRSIIPTYYYLPTTFILIRILLQLCRILFGDKYAIVFCLHFFFHGVRKTIKFDILPHALTHVPSKRHLKSTFSLRHRICFMSLLPLDTRGGSYRVRRNVLLYWLHDARALKYTYCYIFRRSVVSYGGRGGGADVQKLKKIYKNEKKTARGGARRGPCVSNKDASARARRKIGGCNRQRRRWR